MNNSILLDRFNAVLDDPRVKALLGIAGIVGLIFTFVGLSLAAQLEFLAICVGLVLLLYIFLRLRLKAEGQVLIPLKQPGPKSTLPHNKPASPQQSVRTPANQQPSKSSKLTLREIGLGTAAIVLIIALFIGLILGYAMLYSVVFSGIDSFLKQLLFNTTCTPSLFNQPYCTSSPRVPGADIIYDIFAIARIVLFFAIPAWVYKAIRGK